MGVLRKAITMSMKKIIEKYKKEIRSRMLVQPGTPLRTGCTTYSCPMYILMVTLNNNSTDVLEDKIVCPKKMCDRIKKGMFKCSLSESEYSVFSGFFVDDEFFSYESILSKNCLPTLLPILGEEDISHTKEECKDTPREIEKIVESTSLNIKEDSPIEEIRDSLIKDLDNYLGKKQVKSYVRIKDNDLIFSNPIETDLTQINKKIKIIHPFTSSYYREILEELKIFYEGILKVQANSSCSGCAFEYNKDTGVSVACSSCTRNDKIRLLTSIQKIDNYTNGG